MAKILGFTYGELRGKIGGTVYSRNKAGAYARAKVTPVNPQTVQQQTARYRFGNMSILYQALTTAAKDCWQVFASTHFNPLKGNSTGIYSGGNAFVALRQSAGQGNARYDDISGTQGVGGLTFTQIAYVEALEPPDAPVSATMKDSDGVGREFNIQNIVITNAGDLTFNLSFPTGATNPTATINSFTDITDQKFGIGFYISNNLKFEGAKPNTALKINPWDSGVIDAVEKGAGPNGFTVGEISEITLDTNVDPANTRDFPCAGDIVLVTPFVRSITGAQKLMTPQYVTLTEA